jgi:hypothetical protein
LGGIAVFQRNPLRNSCFPRGTLREIQRWYRRIQQRDVKTSNCSSPWSNTMPVALQEMYAHLRLLRCSASF